jgi:hypothetical protein
MAADWKFTGYSTSLDGKVQAQVTLEFSADTREEAEQIVRENLPGAGWSNWTSTYGLILKRIRANKI